MLLRESSTNGPVNLKSIMSEDGRGSGVNHGDILMKLVDGVLKGQSQLEQTRQEVVRALGQAGLVDTAGVIATFTMQNRLADATGLPLDTPIDLATRTMRESLGFDRFGSAQYTTRGGWGKALLARIVEPLIPLLLRSASGMTKRKR